MGIERTHDLPAQTAQTCANPDGHPALDDHLLDETRTLVTLEGAPSACILPPPVDSSAAIGREQ
jgi:hypothetical protein